jgi:dTDP-4-amino-4,6-dideoxygalactose transaminase
MIPYFKPTYTDESRAAISEALQATTKPGQYVLKFEAEIAKRLGIEARRVLCTNSCTAALHLAYEGWVQRRLTKTRRFCVVQAPAMTWPSTYAWSPAEHRCLVDIDKRALMPQFKSLDYWSLHYLVDLYGRGIHPNNIDAILGGRKPFVLDAAHNLLDPHHGYIADMPNCIGICYSFFHTKQLSTIRGGVLVIPVRADRSYYEALRDSGTIGRKRVLHLGWNYEMEDVNAALGLQQLQHFYSNRQKTHDILANYRLTFHNARIWGDSGHLAVLRTETIRETKAVQAELKKAGVQTGCHYPVAEWFGDDHYPNAAYISKRITTLPCYPTLSNTDLAIVIEAVQQGLSIGKKGGA